MGKPQFDFTPDELLISDHWAKLPRPIAVVDQTVRLYRLAKAADNV